MKILTAGQMRVIDRRAFEEFGIPSVLLMENAGRRVAEEVLAGRGNPAEERIVKLRRPRWGKTEPSAIWTSTSKS